MRKELKNLTEIEHLIIDKRISGAAFYELNELELRVATDKIIFVCSAVTGCELPATDIFAEALSGEIIKTINECGYGDLSLEEIFLSLRINQKNNLRTPSGIDIEEIQFSGRCVNTTFLSRVLSNYMVIRNMLDRKFQNKIDGY